MHREIDHLTDTDPNVKELNQLLSARHGRYASVVTDIGFDYFLWRNWEEFGPGKFTAFTSASYTNLFARRKYMSPRVRRYVNGMVKDDWLRLYTTRSGMHKVFHRLRPRLSRPELLEDVEDVLVDFREEFNQTFLLLFPRLQTLADAYRPATDRPTPDPLQPPA